MRAEPREFFYKRGRVSTSTPWLPPTLDRVNQIINYALPKADALGLELYIMGRCLIDMNTTTDLDMFVYGAVDDQSLEVLLHDLLDYSLNRQRILLDIAWSGVIVPFEDHAGELCFKEHTLKILNPWQLGIGDGAVKKDALAVRRGARLTEYMVELYIDNNDRLSKKHISSLEVEKRYFGIPAKEWIAR